MSVKATGAEFKRFYRDPSIWTQGVWHYDTVLHVDGREWPADVEYDEIPDLAQVTVSSGFIFDDAKDEEVGSFEGVLRKWKKAQTIDVLTVEAPKTKVDAIRAAIKQAGGKVL